MDGPRFFQSFNQSEYDPENDDVLYVDPSELENVPFSWRSEKWKIGIMWYSMRMGNDRYATRSHAMHAAKPSDTQRQAGNYRKGHIRVHGLDLAIQ